MTDPATLGLEDPEFVGALPFMREGLRKLLVDAENPHGAARLIAINPVLRAEFQSVLGKLEANALPITPDALTAILRHAAPDLGLVVAPEVMDRLLAPYLETLADMPERAVVSALDRWRASELYPKDPGRHSVFPRPDELEALAQPARIEIKAALYRAHQAVEAIKRLPPPEPTAEEMAARRQFLIDTGVMDASGKFLGLGRAAPVTMPDDDCGEMF